jgi:hypothetical protein
VHRPTPFEQLLDHWHVAGVLQLWINGVLNQVEKGSQTGVTGSSGGALLAFSDLVQE